MKPSVVILAKNEEARLPDCLASVAWSDDIVLIDDHSSDATAPIAAQAGARVLRRRLDGFASQRNYGIGQARNDWVLMLDADERVSPELAAELELLDPAANIAAYSIPFRNHLGRKWLRYGGLYPDRHVRLLDRRRARYGPKEIHETPVISGETCPLAGAVIHYTYRDVRDYLAKVEKYARLEAPLIQRPHRWVPLREFGRRYLRQSGWRDGWCGLVSAVLLAWYQVLLHRYGR